MTPTVEDVVEATLRVVVRSTDMEWITSYGTVYSRHLNPSILPAVREELKYMEEHYNDNVR